MPKTSTPTPVENRRANWFEVDLEGMRELHGARELWQLVKELPVNVFDEYAREDVKKRPTYCKVTLKESEDGTTVLLRVEDDGAGFARLEDIYTLFGNTGKRAQPQVAGRFNLGEKELMAVAIRGSVETTTGSVYFDERGRTEGEGRTKGTLVEAVLRADKMAVLECILKLRMLIPPTGLTYTVNGEPPFDNVLVTTTEGKLDTVIQSAPGEPLRKTTRKTDIVIYEPRDAQPAWLYELGCPVQAIDTPYSIDIRQKIPLPPQRDTVSEKYLRDVYTYVVAAVIDDLPPEQGAEVWVKQAVNKNQDAEVVAKIVNLRHGDKVVMWSADPQANEDAINAGYVVIGPHALSAAEKEVYKGLGGVLPAAQVFGREAGRAEPVKRLTADMKHVAEYAKALARLLLDHEITVDFERQPATPVEAHYGGRILTFNVTTLGESWFKGIRPAVTGLIIHELAHEGSDGNRLPHGPEYIHRLHGLAGKAFHAVIDWPERERFLAA